LQGFVDDEVIDGFGGGEQSAGQIVSLSWPMLSV
jgi:hypothetical protein